MFIPIGASACCRTPAPPPDGGRSFAGGAAGGGGGGGGGTTPPHPRSELFSSIVNMRPMLSPCNIRSHTPHSSSDAMSSSDDSASRGSRKRALLAGALPSSRRLTCGSNDAARSAFIPGTCRSINVPSHPISPRLDISATASLSRSVASRPTVSRDLSTAMRAKSRTVSGRRFERICKAR